MTHPSSRSVLIVGSMAFDDLELPSGTALDVVGGSATYAAYAAALFAPVRVVAVVGDDFPQRELTALGDRGVDVSGVERAAGRTFRWRGRYSQNLASRVSLDTQLNVFADFRPTIPAAFRDSAFVLLGNIHPTLQAEVLDQVGSPRFVAADTMNFWIEGERAALLAVLRRVDTLIINDEEARQLSGEHNLRKAAAAVRTLGPQRLIVKKGEHGAMVFDEHGVFFAPAYPLENEVDPTGAGDTFAGALLGALAGGAEPSGALSRAALRTSLVQAGAVASFCVEGVGTERVRDLSLDRVGARLEELCALVRMD